jgi:uncharacterized protein
MNQSSIIQSFVPLSNLLPSPPSSPLLPARPFSPDVIGETIDRPGVELNEIRQFRVGGKEYVFVPSVTAILSLDKLGQEVVELLRPADHHPPAPVEAVQTPATRHLPLAEIYSALEPRHSQASVVGALKELRDMGVVRLIGIRDGGLNPPAPKLPPMPFPQRTLVLNVANDCNLGCSYCFAGQGDYGTPKRMMSEETARRSVDFLLANSADHKVVTIVFFGGEPLMNLKVIRRLVDYANDAGSRKGKIVEFTMTTNATYLTPEVIDFLSENSVGVSVSIDGPKHYHDLRRTYKNGPGSYDFIRPRILELLNRHHTRPIAARATLTHGVVAVEECFWHLKEMGFHEVGFAPVTSGADDEFALTHDEMWQVLNEFRHLAKTYVEEALQNRYLGFSNVSNVLSELHDGIVKAYPCVAGLGMLGVGVDGDLFLCHRFSESKEHRMGSVQEGLNARKQEQFLRQAHLSQKTGCQSCWVRHICSGGCHHEAYVRHGALHKPNDHYCEWIRTWIDLGLDCYARIMDANPIFFDKVIDRRGA